MYIDLPSEMRTSGQFRHLITELVKRIAFLEPKSQSDPRASDELNSCMVKLYHTCNQNAGFLVPYFFPKYPFEKPLSLSDRPFSYAMFHMQMGGYTVTRASRQIGKSTTYAARQLINAHILPTFKSIYVVPHPSFLDTYANRMRDMERSFRFYQQHKDYRQNLKFKEYPNKSQIYLIKCLTDTVEARSKTTDELLFDECQLLDTELLPDIEQCQKASRMPCTIYAGTSTTVESFLEINYQYSSKGIWVIPAPGYTSDSVGKGWLNCGDENDIIKAIHADGFVNPATKQQLMVHDGHWVHQDRLKLDAGFIGFHIPQVIIPEYVYKPHKWREIIESYTKYRHNMKKFIQEILGIPTEEGQREITLKDLMRMCDDSLTYEQMKARAKKGYYSHVISGCDWGGSDYNPASRVKASYTVHFIIGIAPDKKVDILHMRQYSGMDYRSIINCIVKDHAEFNGSAIGSDFGVGAAYNMLLRERQEISAERHMIFGYVGPNTAPLSQPASGPGWFNQFSLNRTESISSLYSAIKTGDLRCYNWNESQDRLLELLNLYRIPTESATGVQSFRYEKHGARPDDSLHALNFAFVIAQLIRGVPIVEDMALKTRINEMFNQNSGGAETIWGWPNSGHISG
jgi:hypothetical protein